MKGLVLSGGGVRAAYQVGVLKALIETSSPEERDFQILFGSSIGAVNTVLYAAGLRKSPEDAIEIMESLWRERTLANSFAGNISMAFLRSIKVAFLQCLQPGPAPTSTSIFNPTPLSQTIDETLFSLGGASIDNHPANLKAIGVTATAEGESRRSVLLANYLNEPTDEMAKGMRFEIHKVNHFSSSHILASAALPFVLPPVKIDIEDTSLELIDGGIANNLPVDPAVRFGAEDVILVDTSGKKWWHDFHERPYDTQETWAIESSIGSSCIRPQKFKEILSPVSFGSVLKDCMGSSTKDLIQALGPMLPVYKVLKTSMGEELALEAVSYTTLYKPYIEKLLDLGYKETIEGLNQSNSNC